MKQQLNIPRIKSQRIPGFSFIELIIYSSLVAMIIGQFLITFQLLSSSSQKDKERHTLIENEQFLHRKIEWLLYGVSPNEIWVIDSTLYVQRATGEYYGLYRNNSTLQLASANNIDSDPEPDSIAVSNKVTNNHITVTSFAVSKQTVNGQTAVHVQATLQGRNGTINFDKTMYPR